METNKKMLPLLDDWGFVPLEHLVEIHDMLRRPVKATERVTGTIPYCGANGIIDYVDGFTHEGEFVMLAEDGGFFKPGEKSTYIMRGRFWANNHVHVLRAADERILAAYLHHYLNYRDLRPFLTGATRPKLTQGAMCGIPVSLPYPDNPARSLETQRRIVARIEALFGELRECRKLHQAVVEDTNRLIDAVLAEVFGNVDGQNWHPQTLGELVDNYDHVRVPVRKADREKMQGEYPYFGATGVIDFVDSFLFDGEYLLISEDGANLIARKYPIAFIAMGRFWVNNHAHVVRAKPTTSNQYLAYAISATDISHLVTGAAQPKLNQTKMNQIPIWLPKEKTTQDRIVAYLDETQAQLQEMQKSQAENGGLLSEMEQAILAQAFRGEL